MRPPKQRTSFNPKRRIREDCDPDELKKLASRAIYKGSPLHKRNPGDFDLSPPAQPRLNKTLCDTIGLTSRAEAQRLLVAGIAKGLVSKQVRGDFPQNIWSVTEDKTPLEAQLENKDQGTYHGYPMPSTDIFRTQVLKRWRQS